MRRRILFVLGSVIALTSLIGTDMLNQDFNAYGANARLHKRDLPQYGLLIINGSDSTYEKDVTEWTGGRADQVLNKLRPFSAFLRNDSDRDIIAYRLNWEVKMADGEVLNFPRQYFAPGSLMGFRPTDQQEGMTKTIRRNSQRFFTIFPTPLEGGSGAGQMRFEIEDIGKFREGFENNMSLLIQGITNQLGQAIDITISIDGVMFADGAFVGDSRASNDEFLRLKASITSKYDLLEGIKLALRQGRPSIGVLNDVSLVANQEIKIPTPNAEYEDYYAYFRKIRAQEVENIRRTTRDDEKTIAICLKQVEKEWIIPYYETRSKAE